MEILQQINFTHAILAIVVYLIGVFFDKRASLTVISGRKKGRKLAEYLAHLFAEIASVWLWILFGKDNPQFPIIYPLGPIAWVIGTLVMGWLQSRKTDRPLLFFGNGEGNTPEYICSGMVWIYEKILKKNWSITGASIVMRLAILVISTPYIIKYWPWLN